MTDQLSKWKIESAEWSENMCALIICCCRGMWMVIENVCETSFVWATLADLTGDPHRRKKSSISKRIKNLWFYFYHHYFLCVWTWMKAGCDDDPCLFSWLPQLKKNWVGGWNMRTLNDTALFPLGKFLTSMKQVEKYLSIFLIRLAGTYQHCQIEWFIIELSHELWTSLSKDYVGMKLYVVRPEKHAMS